MPLYVSTKTRKHAYLFIDSRLPSPIVLLTTLGFHTLLDPRYYKTAGDNSQVSSGCQLELSFGYLFEDANGNGVSSTLQVKEMPDFLLNSTSDSPEVVVMRWNTFRQLLYHPAAMMCRSRLSHGRLSLTTIQ